MRRYFEEERLDGGGVMPHLRSFGQVCDPHGLMAELQVEAKAIWNAGPPSLMRRGYGRSEGINREEDFGREHNGSGSLIDVSAGIAQAVEDLESAIGFDRKLPGVRPGPVLLAGQSRGGFLAMHYAGLRPGEVMGVVNFSGGWYPYGPVATPYYANAGRGAANKVPQLWLYADNDRLYDKALIREYYQAFVVAGGKR
jgi:pimeloyl-ACP methyl ester carboxylesterase